MYNGFKVVGVTAFGRRRYTSLLVHYLRKARGLIDEHHFWLNTNDADDTLWLKDCVRESPDFFKAVTTPIPLDKGVLPRIHCFYREYAARKDTIFVRFDDDVVWMEPSAIDRLLSFRIAHPEYFVIYANTINNSLCTFIPQKQGLLVDAPLVEYDCMGYQAWANWKIAACAHRALLGKITENKVHEFNFKPWLLNHYERCSINCIAWWGQDMDLINASMRTDEEAVLACDVPLKLGRKNCICGDALVSHFAYTFQRPDLETKTTLLKRYRRLISS